ncbi:hypothetical protein [Escherichia coli]
MQLKAVIADQLNKKQQQSQVRPKRKLVQEKEKKRTIRHASKTF